METVESFQLVAMPHIIFGTGAIEQAGQWCAQLGTKALLVTGRSSLRRSGWLDEIVSNLSDHGVTTTVFEGAEPEPSVNIVQAGCEMLREAGCDQVIAVGGGSSLDVGKAIGALAGEAGEAAEYHRGRQITEPGVPVVAVPTTSGTGSEVTPNAVLIDQERGVKASLRGDGLVPKVAIVDPQLTLTLPPAATAFAGIDAFTQALEGFTSIGANLITDKFAAEALGHLAGAIRTAYRDGDNLAAREHMSLGSLLAGIGFASSRLGLVHGLAHPVGVASGQPHGRVCGLLLPYVIDFNLEAAQEKYARTARLVRITDDSDDEAAALSLRDWVTQLVEDLHIGQSLSDLGISEEDIEPMIAPAMASASTKHNPRQVTEYELRQFLEQIL